MFACFALLSCGDDARSASGVPAGTRLADLSVPEQSELCRWIDDERDARLELSLLCTPDAVLGSSSESECQRLRDACIDGLMTRREQARAERVRVCEETDWDSACSATVGELERCVDATLTSMRSRGARFACGTPAPGRTEEREPSACAPFSSTCAPPF